MADPANPVRVATTVSAGISRSHRRVLHEITAMAARTIQLTIERLKKAGGTSATWFVMLWRVFTPCGSVIANGTKFPHELILAMAFARCAKATTGAAPV